MVNIKVFLNLKDILFVLVMGAYLICPILQQQKKAFDIPSDTVFERFLSRGRVSCILDVHSKHILTSKIVSRNVGEVKLAIEHLNNLNKRFDLTKLVVIYDRGYGSTELILNSIYLNSKFLIRLNGQVFKKKVQQMTSDDEIIQLNIKNYILKKIDDEKVKEFAVKMEVLEFRVVKVKLKNGDIEVLATNLDENEFSKNDLKELYGKRWTIETGYDKLKNFIELEEFSGIRKEIIEQDFYAGIFIYNIATTVKFDIENRNARETKNKDKKYNITANFSSIITLIYDYLYPLVIESKSMKEKNNRLYSSFSLQRIIL